MARRKGKAKRILDYAAPEVPLAQPGIWSCRGTLILAAIVLTWFVFFAYAGRMWAAALYRLVAELPGLLAWLGAMLGVGAVLLRCFRLRGVITAIALGI